MAERIVLTSDNPRNEDPRAIMDQIAAGIGTHAGLSREIDRKRAIQLALRDADSADWLVIAGKGHEQYQDTAGIKSAFSDGAVVLGT
jgi:UDP-N-acetylmuramoyl-L-alanyl-D-glutamate--2,6-diaminopimelate ligase